MEILLTAFDPFGGAKINPAWEAVSRVRENWESGHVTRLLVPTVFGDAEKLVLETAEKISADVILCVGQAGGRYGISVERVALNLDDASIPDNRGNQPMDQRISDEGETAYLATIPVKKVVAAVQAAGVPAELSYTAGTFVCNHLLYRVLEDSARNHPDRLGGFLHVPFLPEQVAYRGHTPSMSLEVIIKGLEAAVQAVFQEVSR